MPYINFFDENYTNLRKVWQGIKEIINLKSKNCATPTCLIDKDKTVTNSKTLLKISNSTSQPLQALY